MIPWTERSRAFVSHEFGVEPYRGLEREGIWFKENKDGSSGA